MNTMNRAKLLRRYLNYRKLALDPGITIDQRVVTEELAALRQALELEGFSQNRLDRIWKRWINDARS